MALEIASALVRFIQFKVNWLLSTREGRMTRRYRSRYRSGKSSGGIGLSLQICSDFGELGECACRSSTISTAMMSGSFSQSKFNL